VYWRRRLTRLEIALYAALVGIVAAVFLERLLTYMELAERTAMEITVDRINSALRLRLAGDMLEGRLIDVPAALDRNPFELARMAPANFHRQLDGSSIGDLERGYWVFDRQRRELVYLPRLHRRLQTDDPDDAVRFHLIPGMGTTYVLVPASKYSWNWTF